MTSLLLTIVVHFSEVKVDSVTYLKLHKKPGFSYLFRTCLDSRRFLSFSSIEKKSGIVDNDKI